MMILKWIGAASILASCGSVGFMIRMSHNKEINSLKMFISALDFMECELQFRMYALPELCRLTAQECEGSLRKFFSLLSNELEDQISPDVKRCINAVLTKMKDLPSSTLDGIESLGNSLGRFDLQGQLKGLESVRRECRVKLNKLAGNSESRLRSYQTLGLCAGAAVVILLV